VHHNDRISANGTILRWHFLRQRIVGWRVPFSRSFRGGTFDVTGSGSGATGWTAANAATRDRAQDPRHLFRSEPGQHLHLALSGGTLLVTFTFLTLVRTLKFRGPLANQGSLPCARFPYACQVEPEA
jgi:hypothetical protein